LIDPEDFRGIEGNGGHYGAGAPVMTGADASPVLEASEHGVDPVATPAKGGSKGDWHLAALA
jgi:hypothetical protein